MNKKEIKKSLIKNGYTETMSEVMSSEIIKYIECEIKKDRDKIIKKIQKSGVILLSEDECDYYSSRLKNKMEEEINRIDI